MTVMLGCEDSHSLALNPPQVVGVHLNKWTLDKRLGLTCLLMYSIFLCFSRSIFSRPSRIHAGSVRLFTASAFVKEGHQIAMKRLLQDLNTTPFFCVECVQNIV